jgi:hypothetical protein
MHSVEPESHWDVEGSRVLIMIKKILLILTVCLLSGACEERYETPEGTWVCYPIVGERAGTPWLQAHCDFYPN